MCVVCCLLFVLFLAVACYRPLMLRSSSYVLFVVVCCLLFVVCRLSVRVDVFLFVAVIVWWCALIEGVVALSMFLVCRLVYVVVRLLFVVCCLDCFSCCLSVVVVCCL